MKKFLFAAFALFLFAGATPLTACATLAPQAAQVSLQADKAALIAELAYSAYATGVLAVLPGLPPSQQATVRRADQRVYTALLAMRSGTQTAQAVLDQIAAAAPAISQGAPH